MELQPLLDTAGATMKSPRRPSPAPTSTFTLRLQHKAVGVGDSHGSNLVTLFTLAGKDGNSEASGRSRGSSTDRSEQGSPGDHNKVPSSS